MLEYEKLYGVRYNGISLPNKTGIILYTGDSVSRKNITGYASGTDNATKGLHAFDENGSEYIFSSSNGSKYRLFSSGEKVLNASAANFLYRFANSGGKIIKDIVEKAYAGAVSGIRGVGQSNNVVMGDIIINGNANEKTVSEIRRVQREGINTILKEFSKLKR